jgi:hypothetical protein
MRFGQMIAGAGIGFGLAAGALGGWTAFQKWQTKSPQPINYSQPAPQSPQAIPASQTTTLVPFSQAENDYLYDLSQALQSVEQRRLTDAERLAIGHQIAGWLQTGSRYWDVRAKFDQVYKTSVAGDYGHNRDVYIKFATERLAPAFIATLTPPEPEPQVILNTKTEYIETPGPTKVITVPEPFPVPVPYPVPGHDSPHRPDHPHHPDHPDYPHHPDRPDHPDEPDHPSDPGNPDTPVGSEPPEPTDPDEEQPSEPDVIVTEPEPEQPPAQPEPEPLPDTGEEQTNEPAPESELPGNGGSESIQTSEVSY